MAGMCCGVVGEAETARTSRRRGLEVLPLKIVSDVSSVLAPGEARRKRRKLRLSSSLPRECENAVQSSALEEVRAGGVEEVRAGGLEKQSELVSSKSESLISSSPEKVLPEEAEIDKEKPKFGMTSVCGRRRDMEDTVAIHPSFLTPNSEFPPSDSHFFGVYDGHGCSHVSARCKDRLHEIVKEELESCDKPTAAWAGAMERSFSRMDKEIHQLRGRVASSNCRCELQTPQCDAVGSTAVVAVVTPEKVIVSNCGDSRAVLCRNGVTIPLSSDHKPDRPDELERIEEAGGRVIYWDGARVLGVLAMSRAIGDGYLKPFVIPDPEVTVMDRTEDDECLILASDGLWDVVDNATACGVVRMCLNAQKTTKAPPSPPPVESTASGGASESSDKACYDASLLLTKLALARHSTDNVSVVVVDLRRNL